MQPISNYIYDLPLKPFQSRTFTMTWSKWLMMTLLPGWDFRGQKAQRQSKANFTYTQTWHTNLTPSRTLLYINHLPGSEQFFYSENLAESAPKGRPSSQASPSLSLQLVTKNVRLAPHLSTASPLLLPSPLTLLLFHRQDLITALWTGLSPTSPKCHHYQQVSSARFPSLEEH